MQPLLAVTLIVKNEACSIAEVIDCARPAVDHFTIIDTGSIDGTQEIIRSKMQGKDLLVEEPFVDFATTRNRAFQLELLRGERDIATFCLALSGDEFLQHPEKLREHLELYRNVPAYDAAYVSLTFDSGEDLDHITNGYQLRLIRTESGWHYKGRVHEVLVNTDGRNSTLNKIPEDIVIAHVVKNPEARIASIVKHLPLLETMLDEDPQDARSLIHLTNTHLTCSKLCDRKKPSSKWYYHIAAAMSCSVRLLELPVAEATHVDAEAKILDFSHALHVLSDEEVLRKLEVLCGKYPTYGDLYRMRSIYALRCLSAKQTLTYLETALIKIKEQFVWQDKRPIEQDHYRVTKKTLADVYEMMLDVLGEMYETAQGSLKKTEYHERMEKVYDEMQAWGLRV